MDNDDSIEFAQVTPPEASVHAEATALQHERIPPPASLGRMGTLGGWLAACQGHSPPRVLSQPTAVLFAADHGVTANAVSAYPPAATAQRLGSVRRGDAAINTLAQSAGASLRMHDVAVDSDTTEPAAEFKVRRGSGAIDTEDALTHAETVAALRAGARAADAEIDAGADVLVAGAIGVGASTPSSVLVAALTGNEPVAVVGRGSGIDDAAWMRKVAAVRDALRRARGMLADPVGLLRTAGGADLAALAGFLAHAATRRTPVLLDGLVVGAAALVAERLAPDARFWWLAAHRTPEPAHRFVLEHLDLAPVLELDVRRDDSTGALAALPLLSMAGQVLADIATAEPSDRSPTTT